MVPHPVEEQRDHDHEERVPHRSKNGRDPLRVHGRLLAVFLSIVDPTTSVRRTVRTFVSALELTATSVRTPLADLHRVRVVLPTRRRLGLLFHGACYSFQGCFDVEVDLIGETKTP